MNLPKTVHLVEVGPRDGFQMETRFLPTELKVRTLEALAEAGFREIEATSFVHPKVVPQMADAAEVLTRVRRRPGVRYLALVPNLYGAERALEARVDGLRQVISVTDGYNRRNVGQTVEESLRGLGEVVRRAEPSGVAVEAVLAAAFGCPLEGEVSTEVVVDVAQRSVAAGARALGLADSAGLGHPLQVRRLLDAVRQALPEVPLWLHLHDTRGLGLANALAGLEAGIDRFDTSLGGLGGCPTVVGASGNIPSEEMIYLCDAMGIETGVNLAAVRQASGVLGDFLGRRLESRVLYAGTHDELVARNARKTP
jgi:hydroxymethylglutaryl-CoA lyase